MIKNKIILLIIIIFIILQGGCKKEELITPTPVPAVSATPIEKNPSALSDSSWPMEGHDSSHSGYANYLGPVKGNLKWFFKTDGKIYSSPVTGKDGVIYTGSDDTHLYAINPDGTLKWKFKTKGKIRSTPSVTGEESIYFLSHDGFLYSLNSEGQLNWTFEMEEKGDFLSSPSLDSEGNIYFTGGPENNTCLYSISPEGKKRWKIKTAISTENTPAIDDKNLIYVSAGGIYVYNQAGEELWNIKENGITTTQSLGNDNNIYAGINGENNSFLLNIREKDKIWQTQVNGYIKGFPAISREGNIYSVSYDGKIYSFTHDGKLNWTVKTDNIINSSPAIDGENNIYTGSYDKNLYAVNKKGDLLWTFKCNGPINSTPAIGDNETLYFTSLDGNIYALHSGQSAENSCIIQEKTDDIHFTGNIYGQREERNWKSAFSGPLKAKLNWSVRVGDLAITEPVISDGKIYAGTGERDKEGKLYCFNMDGNIEWIFQDIGESSFSKPVKGPDGTLYLTTWSGEIIAIDKKGSLKWKFTADDSFKFPPVLDENLIYASCGNEVYCITKEGKMKWKNTLDDLIISPPLPCSDGTLYQPTGEGYIYIITKDGKIKKKRNTKVNIYNASIDETGRIYLGSYDGLYVNKKDGSTEKLYGFTEGIKIYEGPFINSTGEIFIATKNITESKTISNLLCIDKMGNLKWEYYTDGMVKLLPAEGNNNIYVAGEKGNITVFNQRGEEIWSYNAKGNILNPPAISEDGEIFLIYSVINEKEKNIIESGMEKIDETGKGSLFYLFSGGEKPAFPITDEKGQIYIASKNKLYCLNEKGSEKWSVLLNSEINEFPSVDREGNIYTGGKDGILRAFDRDRNLLWVFKTGGSLESSPLTDEENNIYFGSNDGNLYSLDNKGKKKWQFDTGKPLKNHPKLKGNYVYILSEKEYLYIINKKGKEEKKLKTGEKSLYTISDNNIYIYGEGLLKIFDLNGENIQKYSLNLNIKNEPVFDSYSNSLYLTDEKGILYSINRDGKINWTFETGKEIRSPPLVDKRGNIYITTMEGLIYSINYYGIKIWSIDMNSPLFFPPNITDKGFLLVTTEGFIHSVGE